MRVRLALEQRLPHDRALEVAIYELESSLPELPPDTHWKPRLPSQVTPLPPPPPTHAAKPPTHAAKVKAYLRTEQGQVRQGVSAPIRVPKQISHVGSLPPPPRPPGVAGAVAGARTTAVVSPAPIPPASGGYAPACRVITTPPPPLASGGYAPARWSGGSVPSHASASGSFAPACGPKIHGVQPPLPIGPPPPKVPSVTTVVANRRSFASANTRTAVDQFSRTLTPEVGSALVMTVDTTSKSEIASNVHDNLPAPAAENTVENNLGAYLQAACSGDGRPVGSHPMRLASVLVSGALEDIQREYGSANLARPVAPGGVTELAKRCRDCVIYLAVLVASVFDPTRFDACLREICAFNDDGTPDENCWRRALNYITLTAARFQFISHIVLPADLHDRCVGKEVDPVMSPVPITIRSVPYVIWSDSTLATKPNKTPGVKKPPKPQMLPNHLRPVKQHKILFEEVYCCGTLVNLLEWVEKLAPADVKGCVFVCVWSFNDFFVKPGKKKPTVVMYHIPDEFYNHLNRLICRLETLFEKSVMICGGTSQTWSIRDTVYDIQAARVRERLRQGGILVVSPTDLFDTLPKREHGPWHFFCLGYNDKVDGFDPTQHSLETLISHVVLIAYHLIESNIVIKHRARTWAEDMKPQSVIARITLAIQYDPREDVFPLSCSRRMNDQGTGTIDLQRLEQFGIDPTRLRVRVPKARTQPYDVHHFRPENLNNATANELFNMVFEGGELVFSPAEVEDIAMNEQRSPSASPARCSDEDLLKGQMLAAGSWFDVVVEIVWGSKRHAGMKNSIKPFHWMILQFARQNMVPSDGSLFDLFPGERSPYHDNHFSQGGKCKQKWWIVDTPILGICPVCERDVIVDSLDIKATLDASPNEPFKCFSEADEARDDPTEGNKDVDETVDFGVALDLEEQDVAGLLRAGPGPTTVVNPKFCAKRYRQWIDLLALNGVRMILVRSTVLTKVRPTDSLNRSLRARKLIPATTTPMSLSRVNTTVRLLLTSL